MGRPRKSAPERTWDGGFIRRDSRNRDVYVIRKQMGGKRYKVSTRARTWECHLDAMFAELEVHVPTLNGYSGANPQGWDALEDSNFSNPLGETRIDQALAAWAKRTGIPRESICWIKYPRAPVQSASGASR